MSRNLWWSIMAKKKRERVWDRFEWHYTPKHASWLNQAEIEIGLYVRGCIGKDRIGSIQELRERTNAWKRRMNVKKAKIDWKFTSEQAREKMKYSIKTFKSKH